MNRSVIIEACGANYRVYFEGVRVVLIFRKGFKAISWRLVWRPGGRPMGVKLQIIANTASEQI